MSQRLALVSVLAACSFHGSGEGSSTDAKPITDAAPLLDGAPPVDVPDGFVFMDAPPDAPPDGFVVPMCPATYGPINGIGMYRNVEGDDKTWDDAAADCNDDSATGGPYTGFTHLLVMTSEAERTGITGAGTPITGNTWFGLHDVVEGTYIWVTAEPTNNYAAVGDHPPWDANEPDNMANSEDCVRFKNGFSFEDKPCGQSQSFVCECDVFPPN